MSSSMWYWLTIVVGGLLGLFVLWTAIRVTRAVARFRRSPEKRWADRVLRLHSAAGLRVAAENAALREAGPHSSEDEGLRERALERYLAGISVAELESYPGIGPATIAKLRAAEFEHLADLNGRAVEVEGLG